MSKESRFELQETPIKGVALRKEPGTKVDILEKTTTELCLLARRFQEEKTKVDTAGEQKDVIRSQIIEIVKDHESLRGINIEDINLALSVYPSEEVVYHPEYLKENLGPAAYAAVAHERVIAQIVVPAGYTTKKGRGETITREVIEGAIVKALRKLGFDSEELKAIMDVQVSVTVNHNELEKVIKQTGVEISLEAKTVKKTWNVRVEALKKHQAVAAKLEVDEVPAEAPF